MADMFLSLSAVSAAFGFGKGLCYLIRPTADRERSLRFWIVGAVIMFGMYCATR